LLGKLQYLVLFSLLETKVVNLTYVIKRQGKRTKNEKPNTTEDTNFNVETLAGKTMGASQQNFTMTESVYTTPGIFHRFNVSRAAAY
jgi:hypothetical protein